MYIRAVSLSLSLSLSAYLNHQHLLMKHAFTMQASSTLFTDNHEV